MKLKLLNKSLIYRDWFSCSYLYLLTRSCIIKFKEKIPNSFFLRFQILKFAEKFPVLLIDINKHADNICHLPFDIIQAGN